MTQIMNIWMQVEDVGNNSEALNSSKVSFTGVHIFIAA